MKKAELLNAHFHLQSLLDDENVNVPVVILVMNTLNNVQFENKKKKKN